MQRYKIISIDANSSEFFYKNDCFIALCTQLKNCFALKILHFFGQVKIYSYFCI